MTKDRVKRELQSIAYCTKNTLNNNLKLFNYKINMRFNAHVNDRIFDRSKNIERDLRNINFICQRLSSNYIGQLLHYFHNSSNNTDITLIKKYKDNYVYCFMLGLTFQKFDDLNFNIIVKTFIPEYNIRMYDRSILEIKGSTPKIKLNNNLHRMLYSNICPESLYVLR